MTHYSLGFIGGGRITKIFLHAFKKKNISFNKIAVFDPDKNALAKLQNDFPYIATNPDNINEVVSCDIIFLAVHPPLFNNVLTNIKPLLQKTSILISLAPKITIEKIMLTLDGFQNIVRVNPSATGIINQGINPVAFSQTIDKTNRQTVLNILSVLGKTPIIEETKIESYAIISAMGSTYFWFQFQKLEELAVSFGMDNDEAKNVIIDMVNGSTNLLFHSNFTPNEVMDLVPVKPLGEFEEIIKSYYTEKLNSVYQKIKS